MIRHYKSYLLAAKDADDLLEVWAHLYDRELLLSHRFLIEASDVVLFVVHLTVK